jgi:hypothetical protein
MTNRNPFQFDERTSQLFRTVCTVLYLITMVALAGIQFFRQSEHEDISILLTFNVLALLGAMLFVGGWINPRKWRLRWIVIGYAGFVALGLIFTVVKYAVVLGQPVGLPQIGNYFISVLGVSAVLALIMGAIAFLGSRRIEKQIE